MERQENKFPSRWRYLLGFLVAAGGVTVFAVLLVSNINPDLRFVMPGSHQVEMEKGSYTLFYEYRSEINGQVFSSSVDVPGIRIVVIAPDQQGVELTQPSFNKNYKIGGRSGYSVLNFDIDSPGIYTIGGGYPEGTTSNDIVMAVGKSSAGSVIFAIVSILVGLVLGGILMLTTFLSRRSIVSGGIQTAVTGDPDETSALSSSRPGDEA